MITNHEIKNIYNEKVLVLYLDFSIEVGSLGSGNNESFLSTVKKYIDKLNIKEKYQKVLIMSGSIALATLLYTSNDIQMVSSINNNENNQTQIVVNVDVPSLEKEDAESNKEEELEVNKGIDNIIDEQDKIDTSKQEDITKPNINNNVSKPTNDEKKDALNIKTDKNESSDKEFESKPIEEKKNMVILHRSNGTILEIELEEYIIGVVAAEMPASFSSEALKTQSVVARTYALKKMSRGEKLTDTVSTQAYIDIGQMQTKWGSDFSKYYNKIKNAVTATEGEYITYQGNYINAVYHSTSNGYTEDAINVWKESYPYLKSVDSSWDIGVSSYERTINKDFQNLLAITGLESDLLELKIISRNPSGRVENIQVGNKIYTGVEFRNLLGLRSTDFDIEIVDNSIQITTRGFGHGVGMSQYGANEMSKLGYNYKQIIKHYYTGVQIRK